MYGQRTIPTSSVTISTMDKPVRLRPTSLHRLRGGGGVSSRDSGYFAITLLLRTLRLERTLIDNAAFVHANAARRQVQLVKIAVIVRDYHNSGAGLHDGRQELFIEFPPEFRVLLGRPLIEQHDRPLLEQADN